eukprot:1148228-Pelagomonas_calceolata.AAC.4
MTACPMRHPPAQQTMHTVVCHDVGSSLAAIMFPSLHGTWHTACSMSAYKSRILYLKLAFPHVVGSSSAAIMFHSLHGSKPGS